MALGGVFPLSFLAYHVREPVRLQRLKDDLRMLGYETESDEVAPRTQEGAAVGDAENDYRLTHSPVRYGIFIGFAVLVTAAIILLFFWVPVPESLRFLIDDRTVVAIRYGFLGSYLFAAFLIYRRYTTEDLHPMVYLNSALTMIAGVIFNFVAFEAITVVVGTGEDGVTDGVGAGLTAIIAFALGYFPYLAIRWFERLSYGALRESQRRSDMLPLSMIDGISEWHESRLRDVGIDNIDNICTVEIRELLFNTAFGAQEVVAWIDQALLLMYLDPSEIESFRRAKVRMISDFHKKWGDIANDTDAQDEMAKQLQTTRERLVLLYASTSEGPNLHRVLHYWDAARQHAEEQRETAKRKIMDDLSQVTEAVGNAFRRAETPQARTDVLRALATSYAEFIDQRMRPPSAPVLSRLGILNTWLGYHKQAFDYYDRAIKVDKRHAHTPNPELYRARGQAHRMLDKYEQAVVDFKKCVELDVSNPEYYGELGFTYILWAKSISGDDSKRSARYQDALTHLKEAIGCNPYDPWWNWYQADVLMSLNRSEEAIEPARDAVGLWRTQNDSDYRDFLTTLAGAQIKTALGSGLQNQECINRVKEAFDNLQKATIAQWSMGPSSAFEDIAEYLGDVAQFCVNCTKEVAQSEVREELLKIACGAVRFGLGVASDHSEAVPQDKIGRLKDLELQSCDKAQADEANPVIHGLLTRRDS